MTIKQLIEQLQKFDGDYLIVAQNSEQDTCCDVEQVTQFPNQPIVLINLSNEVDYEDSRFDVFL